ncbi:MAG: hypothetical protein GXP42_15720 [Chloroflexi bacterium]|nr:hypothetical protein [Chloroflexota bacterium]
MNQDAIFERLIMNATVVSLPITLEQIAEAVRRLSPKDRQRLFEMVFEAEKTEPATSILDVDDAVKAVQDRLKESLDKWPLSPEEPFVDGLSLGEYLDLPDEERERLWREWAN